MADLKSYRLRNRYGLHVFLIPFKNNSYILECKDCHHVRAGFTPDDRSINFVDPEGGPFLGSGSNINKIEIVDLETKELIPYTEQSGKKTAFVLTFENGIVPKDLITDTF